MEKLLYFFPFSFDLHLQFQCFCFGIVELWGWGVILEKWVLKILLFFVFCSQRIIGLRKQAYIIIIKKSINGKLHNGWCLLLCRMLLSAMCRWLDQMARHGTSHQNFLLDFGHCLHSTSDICLLLSEQMVRFHSVFRRYDQLPNNK